MPRGAAPPLEQQLAQLGQLGLGPGAAPPGLLQMAMGDGGDGGGRGGGAPAEQATWYNPAAAPSEYFNATTHMPVVLDASQAAQQAGTTLQGLAGSFFPRMLENTQNQGYQIPNDRGGFFNVEDLYRKLGRDVPRIGTFQSNAPSTNNWRLLGRGPGWIMRNGQMIDTNSAGGQAGGPANWSAGGGISAEHFISGRGNTPLGAGQGYGVPNMIQAGAGHGVGWGWPGADQWNSTSVY